MTSRDEKVMWFTSVLVLLGGFLFVVQPIEHQISLAKASEFENFTMLAQNSLILSREPLLESRKHHYDIELNRIALHDDMPSIVARFIRAAAMTSGLHHVTITAVGGDREPASNDDAGLRFASEPLRLTLRGSYPDLLATIRRLSRGEVLADVTISSVERVPQSLTSQEALLDAHVIIALKRLRDAKRELHTDVSPRSS
jgi:hypothetical protein